MPDTISPADASRNVPAWDKDLIFSTLADPARRRLLLSLAAAGPRPAADLTGASGKRLDATLKHLVGLRAAGLVVQQENPRDGRKYLYALSPSVPLVKSEQGTALDFGFVLVRL